MMKYKIKITDRDRYISWANGMWYGTNEVPTMFSKEETDKIISDLDKYYIYKVEVLDEDNNLVKEVNLLSNRTISTEVDNLPQEEVKPEIEPIKEEIKPVQEVKKPKFILHIRKRA